MRVLASIAVVDLVVAAHDGTSASANGIRERPEIELVESGVIDVGTNAFSNVEAVSNCLRSLSEMFLLVSDVMLGA